MRDALGSAKRSAHGGAVRGGAGGDGGSAPGACCGRACGPVSRSGAPIPVIAHAALRQASQEQQQQQSPRRRRRPAPAAPSPQGTPLGPAGNPRTPRSQHVARRQPPSSGSSTERLRPFLARHVQKDLAGSAGNRWGMGAARVAADLFLGWRVKDQATGQLIGRVTEVKVLGCDDEEDGTAAGAVGLTQHAAALDAVADGSVLLCACRPARLQLLKRSSSSGVAATAVGAVQSSRTMLGESRLPPSWWVGTEAHHIPLVPDLLPAVRPAARELLARLPPGFLDLGRRQLLTDCLAQALLPYTQQQQQQQPRSGTPVMPTLAALQAAGRPDLARLVVRAGGYSTVAAALGWAATRRPPGYWDDLGNLDAELEAFVRSAWVELPAAGGGEASGQDADGAGTPPCASSTYLYNQVTGEVWSGGAGSGGQPPGHSRRSAVVPTLTQLRAGGRSDLAAAISRAGGVRVVAELLGRKPRGGGGGRVGIASDGFESDADGGEEHGSHDQMLIEELDALAEELGLSTGRLPTLAQLRAAGRCDLVRRVRLRGGWAAVGRAFDRATARGARGAMADLEAAAAAMAAFVRGLREQEAAKDEDATAAADAGALPTAYALYAARRSDLLYALRLHGRDALAAAAGLQPRAQPRPAPPVSSHAAVYAAVYAMVSAEKLGELDIRDQRGCVQRGLGSDGEAGGATQLPRLPSFTCRQLQRALVDCAGLVTTRQQVRGVLAKLVHQGLVFPPSFTRQRGVFRAAWAQAAATAAVPAAEGAEADRQTV